MEQEYGAIPALANIPKETMEVPNTFGKKMQLVAVYTGLGKPFNRFCVGAVASSALLLAIRPRYCFRENGELRPLKHPWSVEEDATYCHFFLVPTLTAFVLGQCL